VTVTGVDDFVDNPDVPYNIVLSPAQSNDPAYNGRQPPNVAVLNKNTDRAGVTVQPTSGLVTDEFGGTATFQVKLNSKPTANVTILIVSSDASEGKIISPNLVFTPDNWNQWQTVTVQGVDDKVDDGDATYTAILSGAISGDPKYQGLNVPDVQITNREKAPPEGVYKGSFKGFVADNGSDSGDPGTEPFRDNNYGGPGTITVTRSPSGGFDVNLDANVNQSFETPESFSIGHFQEQWHVAQITSSPLTFDVAMNDHVNMHASGSFMGNTFQGTWTMIQTMANDNSDSGSGTFMFTLQ
jgi:hypothetical protein